LAPSDIYQMKPGVVSQWLCHDDSTNQGWKNLGFLEKDF